jgi:hypothetical protein
MIKKYSLVFTLFFSGLFFSYAQCADLFISEYVEGSGFNKYIEIYNPTNTDITLNGVYTIERYTNGSPTVSATLNLAGTITAYSTFVIGNPRADIGVITDQDSRVINFNGDDAVALIKSGVIIDVIGQIGFDPGAAWTGTTCGTENTTLIRNSTIQIGDSNGSDVFDPDSEWTCLNIDDFSDLGFHTSTCFQSNEIQLQFPVGTDIPCGYNHDFGSQNIETNTDLVIRILNSGTLDLDITNLSFATGSDFSLVAPPTLPLVLIGGMFLDITIRFSPNSLGVYNDVLTILNSDTSEASCSINLQGKGITACATATQIIAAQDFESSISDTWNFTANHAELINNWYVANSLSNIATAQNNTSFWGITDLERGGHMGLTHELIFDAIDVSAFDNVELSFYYYTVDLDGGDSLEYELIYDGTFQGRVDISTNNSAWTNVIINIPDIVDSVEIIFYTDLDAANDQAGIDNLTLSSTSLTTVTWDGTTWNWSDSTPQGTLPTSINTVVMNGGYNTTNNGGSFSACSLIVNSGTLTIADGFYVEVINDVSVSGGRITTETQGSFVQFGDGSDAGTFTHNSGNSDVIKTTAELANWYDYTYWSSPVENETTDTALFQANPSYRFWFNAVNFIDINGDGIDDDANAWTRASGNFLMSPGQGFAATHNAAFFIPNRAYDFIFNGPYNTGDITYPVINNSANYEVFHWNLIGNPYPSAIDTDLFFSTNSGVIEQVAYLWSHVNPPLGVNPGNEVLNFNQNDYITISTVSVAGNGADINGDGMFDGNDIPETKIPSGQGFFIPSKLLDPIPTTPPVTPVITSQNVTFTNSMRVSGDNANNLFFRGSNEKTKTNDITKETLWVNLSSDIGIYSQISIAYTDFTSDGYDGNSIDTSRNYAGNAGILYSLIEEQGNTPFVIQGKSLSSLNLDEVVKIGFGAYISTEETYRLDLLKTEGKFLTYNTIFLKDNYLDILHDISASHYNFKSKGGTFNDRFEIVFKVNTLSVDENSIEEDGLTIVELNDGNIKFTIKNNRNLTIDSVTIFDIQGRLIYELDGNASTEIYNLSNLNSSAYIAIVLLSNGQLITKKSIKK